MNSFSNNNDYMVRAIAGGEIMAMAVTSKNMVETARLAHNTSPIATAALGRMLTAAVMMGDMLKNPEDKITLQIRGNGPMGGVLVTADTMGTAKGYVSNPLVLLPPKADGHLDVGSAIGEGSLSVMKDLGLKDAYNGHVPLVSGEIAEDITSYFMNSEQTPSSVGLGVFISKDSLQVERAGGFIIQLLPGATDETIDKVEANIGSIGSVTDRLSENNTPEYLLELLLNGLDYEITKKKEVAFKCDCSQDRVERAIKLLGEVEISKLKKESKEVEMKCQFCNKAYTVSLDKI